MAEIRPGGRLEKKARRALWKRSTVFEKSSTSGRGRADAVEHSAKPMRGRRENGERASFCVSIH
ncbi:hypothetical protein HMPREF9440_01301 [Sutterella parvirubra YIT 11816]|uniref:Uncharacterized protein n=1 Tax=Sutterella parvirubra YIT 11816 TaxID=762967 RepID=H3KEY6_9BURK|nr:hypothetical protein HMPREF9440_01301 [Sutterella parvirubra YIT 11816]